jgi:hypothetical protein
LHPPHLMSDTQSAPAGQESWVTIPHLGYPEDTSPTSPLCAAATTTGSSPEPSSASRAPSPQSSWPNSSVSNSSRG